MKAKFVSSLVLAFIFLVLTVIFWPPQYKVSQINKLFPGSLSEQLLTGEKATITLMAVGDVMLGRSVNAKMRSLNDFTYPFAKTVDCLRSADLTFINLESPFYDPCPTTNEGIKFCADPRAVEGLTFAGVDVVNLANNHLRNYGQAGVEITQNFLQENKITFISHEDNFLIKEVKGIRFGFLGFDLTSGYQGEEIIEAIKEKRPQVDLLIISFHWGAEYATAPTTKQVALAHRVIDAGADLILGHHPHVIQKVEDYRGRKIVYSLGNFIFDQPWSEATKKGLVGIFTFREKRLVKSEFKEVSIQDFCQPEFVER